MSRGMDATTASTDGAPRPRIGAALATLGLTVALAASVQAQGSDALLDAARAGDGDGVTTLLADGARPDGTEPDGTTALHWAVHHRTLDAVDALLDAGADVGAANRYGVTPLMLAATNADTAAIDRLLQAGADPNAATPEGETVLMTVARTGAADAVQSLLTAGADPNRTEGWHEQTALMWAAAQNQPAAIEALVAGGGAVDAVSAGGFTPLLFTAREGHLDALGALLANGADPDDTLPNGTSALVLASYNAHYDVVERLLQAGADPNADGQGWTALHQVMWTRRPNLGRNPPFPVPSGRLDALDIVRVLIEHGADPDARQSGEPRDGNRNLLRRIGATPFLLAAKAADVEMMRLLVELGADPGLTTERGTTPLMAAAGVGIWKIGENPGTNDEALAAVTLAWELGNDVNARDDNGDSALHGAIHRGAGGIVRFLAEKGADLDATNGIGWTAHSIAQGVFYPNTFNRHPELVGLLEELGADPTAGTRRPEDLAPWERAAATDPR